MSGPVAAILGPEGEAAFGLTGAERLARQLPRVGLRPGDRAEAEILLRADHVYGASVLAALAAAAPGTVLTDAEGRAVGARVDAASRGWATPLVEAHGRAEALPEGAAAGNGTRTAALPKSASSAIVAAPARHSTRSEAW